MEEAAAAADEDLPSGADRGPEGPAGLASHRIRCAGKPPLGPLARGTRKGSEDLTLPPRRATRRDGDFRDVLPSPAAARQATGEAVLSVVAMDAVVPFSSRRRSLLCGLAQCRAQGA